MDDLEAKHAATRARERRARLLGIAVAIAAMVAAYATVRWPAPGVAAAVGFVVYLIARRGND